MQLLGFPRTPMRATALVQTSPADTFFVLSAIERAGSAPRFWGQKMQRLLSIAVTLPDIGWTNTVQPMPFSAQIFSSEVKLPQGLRYAGMLTHLRSRRQNHLEDCPVPITFGGATHPNHAVVFLNDAL